MAIKRNLSSPLAASIFDGPGDGKKKKKKKGNEDVSKWTDEQWKKYKGSKAHRKFLKEQHEEPLKRSDLKGDAEALKLYDSIHGKKGKKKNEQ